MIKRALLLSVLALAVGASEASAAVRPGATTVLVEDGSPGWPYQRWVNLARVPTPSGVVTVTETQENCSPSAFACVRPDDPRTIYFYFDPPMPRFWFLHELGHVYHLLYLDEAERSRFTALDVHGPRTWNSERFANAYAECAIRARPTQRLQRICRFVRQSRT